MNRANSQRSAMTTSGTAIGKLPSLLKINSHDETPAIALVRSANHSSMSSRANKYVKTSVNRLTRTEASFNDQ